MASEERRVRENEASPLPTRAAALIERECRASGIIKGLKKSLGPQPEATGRHDGYRNLAIATIAHILGGDLLTSMKLS